MKYVLILYILVINDYTTIRVDLKNLRFKEKENLKGNKNNFKLNRRKYLMSNNSLIDSNLMLKKPV